MNDGYSPKAGVHQPSQNGWFDQAPALFEQGTTFGVSSMCKRELEPAMRMILLLLPMLLCFTKAFSSQEATLSFSSFELNSDGIDASGPITVIGKSNQDGALSSISVTFLDQEYEIPSDLLQQLPKGFNGIQMSYTRGYKRLGGRTLYLRFTVGWLSPESKPYAQTAIAIKESGSIEVLQHRTYKSE